MNKKIKLDLHTHPIEALKEKLGIKSVLDIDKEAASAIVRVIKSAGLDGIAVTEDNNFNQGWTVSLEIAEQFKSENLIILPGAEIDYAGLRFLSIYVPDRVRRKIPFFLGKEWFSILAHPGYSSGVDLQKLMEVDFDAVEGTSILGDFPLAAEISVEKIIPIIKASDARRLEDIGSSFMELEIQ